MSVVRDAVAELGIPLDVIELKSIKTARSASTAGSRANAAINELSDSVKAFYGSRMYKYVDDGVTKYSSNHLYQQTLKQHVDWAEANNAAIVIISTGDNRSVEEQKFQRFIEDYAPDGLRAGYFTMPWDGVMVLQINESFSRLRNMVADAYEETVTIEDFMDAIERNEDAMLDGYLNLMAVGERRLINFAISEDFDAFQSIQLYDMRRNMLKLFEQASSKFIIGLTRLSPQDTKYLKQIQQAIKDIKLIADEYSSTTGTEQQCLEYLGASAEMNELVAQVYARWESLRTERIPMLFKSMEFASPRLFRLWRAAFTPALDITKASYHHRIETLSSIDDLIHIYNGAMHS